MSNQVYLHLDEMFTLMGRQTASLFYRDLKIFLKSSNIGYQFVWDDTGMWLPKGVWVDSVEDITYIKLKFGL